MLCLLGPSGSGKTTLLRIAAGIEPQTLGRVLLNDREIAGPSVFLPPEQRSIGLVFQDFALFPHLTILDNVRFGLTALSREEARREAHIALSRVGLEHHANSFPHVLSGGEQQRVALARALAPRPAVLLMDEPFSGLDSRLKDTVRAETLAILRESRATAIVVTHDAEEAMRLGDRIALLKSGRLVQAGRAEELYLKPADLFVAGFFSELNVFESRVRGGVGRYAGRQGRGQRPRRRRARHRRRAHGRFRRQRDGQAKPRRASCRGAISASSNSSNSPFRGSKSPSAPGSAAAHCLLKREISGFRSGSLTYLCLKPATKTHRSSPEKHGKRVTMGSFSIWHWLIVLVVVLLVFGRGKIPELMGDMAKGIKSFKKGMADDDAADDAKTVEHRADETLNTAKEKASKS